MTIGLKASADNTTGSIQINGSDRVTVDSAGRVGINTTPSAWQSGRSVLQVGASALDSGGNAQAAVSANRYFDGANNRYINTAAATVYQQSDGEHIWYAAIPGTAGDNITFAERLRLPATGGITGTNSVGSNFNIEASSGTLFSNSIYNSTTAVGASVSITGTAGFLQRSTSSIKYKTAVEDIDPALTSTIYDMRPVWYRSLCETDRKDWSYYGLIAEEIALLEPRLVHWGAPDENGVQEPEGVMYDRIVVLLIAELKKLRDRVAALEAKP